MPVSIEPGDTFQIDVSDDMQLTFKHLTAREMQSLMRKWEAVGDADAGADAIDAIISCVQASLVSVVHDGENVEPSELADLVTMRTLNKIAADMFSGLAGADDLGNSE